MADRVVRCHSKKGVVPRRGQVPPNEKPPWDGPELIPCDANIFSDLVNLARWNVALTSHLPIRVDDGDGNQISNSKNQYGNAITSQPPDTACTERQWEPMGHNRCLKASISDGSCSKKREKNVHSTSVSTY